MVAARAVEHPVGVGSTADALESDLPRFRRLLNGLAIAVFGLAGVEAVTFAVFRDPTVGVTAGALVVFGACILYARHEAVRGHAEQALTTMGLAILAADLVVALAQPVLLPILTLIPLLVIVVALPYATGRALVPFAIGAWLVSVTVAALAEFVPSLTRLPGWYLSLFRVTALAVALALVLLLLWQFSTRLNLALAEMKRANANLQDTNLRLNEMDALKTQFLNTAAHELGTPLTPIKVQLHLLQDALDKMDPRQRKAVLLMGRNVDRLQGLVQDVLDSARLQAGRFVVNRERVDLNRLVMETVESFHAPARERAIRLEMRTTPGLVVDADPNRLNQVLFNFVTNALKFTPAGGRILVEAARQGGELLVRVTDSGAGIPPRELPRLFQPFSQVHDTTRTGFGGSGLGLFISKGIVEQHGGRIWAESDGPDAGSRFAFALPPA